MFAEDFFSMSLEGLIGFLITLISVYLIVRQLQESRLASQMEGYLEIIGRVSDISESIDFIDDLGISKQWEEFKAVEAFEYLVKNEKYRNHYRKLGVLYEGVAALLHRGILDERLAFETFGAMSVKRYQTLKKAIEAHRASLDEPTLYENWEWMAKEFEVETTRRKS